MAKNGLELKWEKCQFCLNEIEYLGYTINDDRIKLGREHVKALLDYHVPRKSKQVQNFFGIGELFHTIFLEFCFNREAFI